MDDFYVTLRDASGVQRTFKRTPGDEVVSQRSARSSTSSCSTNHRQEHARRRRLPGDIEMKRFACVIALLTCARPGVRTERGRSGASSSQPATDSLADLQRRLFRPPLQHAQARSTTRTCKLAEPGVDATALGAGGPPRRRRSRRRRCRSTACCTSRCPITSGRSMRAPAASSGTTRWQSQGRRPHRQPRRRHLGNWLYFETPDCNLVSLDIKDGKERWHKPDLRSRSLLLRHRRAGRRSGTTSSPASSGDDLDIPGYLEVARSGDRRAAVALVRRAAEDGRPGLGHAGRTKKRRSTAAA